MIQTTPRIENVFTETIRTAISSIITKTVEWISGYNGTLEGVTIFTSAIDPGDTWSLSLRGKTIRPTAYPVGNTAIKDDYSLPINAGDKLILTYNSKGTTAKNIDFTPRLSYLGEGF